MEIILPESKKGRKSKENREKYNRQLEYFAKSLIKLDKQMKKERKEIGAEESDISSRGWCYLLEGKKLIDKSQFDYAQKLINLCRKEGLLPIDFCAIDETRKFYNTEDLIKEKQSPEDFLIFYLSFLKRCYKHKDDVSFWEAQECYIQMMVEKIDVLNLFKNICEEYHIPIANAKGWSDLNSRNKLILRFKEAEEMGLKPVLLYYGDFDPAGIFIGDIIKKNLKDLQKATNWNPINLIVDKFGLTYDFIEKNNLTWIDNLITGSKKNLANPRHPDHNKPYVQDYIKKYGIRKCEANAILPIPEIAIKDCEKVIQKYLGDESHLEHKKKVKEVQKEVKDVMLDIYFKQEIKEIKEIVRNHREIGILKALFMYQPSYHEALEKHRRVGEDIERFKQIWKSYKIW